MGSLLKRRRVACVLHLAQAIVLVAGVRGTHLAFQYRPYIYCGSFMCSFSPEYLQIAPPAPGNGDTIDFCAQLYISQLVLIPWLTGMTVLLLSRKVTRKTVFSRFAVAAGGLILLQVVTIASLAVEAWGNGGYWTYLFVFQLILIAGAGLLFLWRLRRNAQARPGMSAFAIAVVGLNVLQGTLVGTDILGSLFSGGFWAFLAGLLLSLVSVIRMAMVRSHPPETTNWRTARLGSARFAVLNFVDEFLLRK